MQRVLRFAESWFDPVPEPGPHDWLGTHPELMQTFDSFRIAFESNKGKIGPTASRQCLHLLPWRLSEQELALVGRIRDMLAAFFWPLRVAVLQPMASVPSLDLNGTADAEEVLKWLASGLRADSTLTLALTSTTLCLRSVAVFGASDWAALVGIINVEEYLRPFLEDPPMPFLSAVSPREMPGLRTEEGKEGLTNNVTVCEELARATCNQYGSVFFRRIVNVVAHQILHMFGILHCCYFRCLMNGSNNEEEERASPPFLCCMCLKKLHLVLGFEPLGRYSRLAVAWTLAGDEEVAKWYQTRVLAVQETFTTVREFVSKRGTSARGRPGAPPRMPAIADQRRPFSAGLYRPRQSQTPRQQTPLQQARLRGEYPPKAAAIEA